MAPQHQHLLWMALALAVCAPVGAVAMLIGTRTRLRRWLRWGMRQALTAQPDPRPGRRREPEIRWGEYD